MHRVAGTPTRRIQGQEVSRAHRKASAFFEWQRHTNSNDALIAPARGKTFGPAVAHKSGPAYAEAAAATARCARSGRREAITRSFSRWINFGSNITISTGKIVIAPSIETNIQTASSRPISASKRMLDQYQNSTEATSVRAVKATAFPEVTSA